MSSHDSAHAPWRIASWSRELGRGTIVAANGDQLDFDAAYAIVDDFEIGEGVHIELERSAGSFRVTKIWPDDPRVGNPGKDRPVPELAPALASRIASTLERMPLFSDYRIRSLQDDLVVEADDANFEYGILMELVFVELEYLELPVRWSGTSFRLANAAERAYLGTRVSMTGETVAIKIRDGKQWYFIVCRDFLVRRTGTKSSSSQREDGERRPPS